MPKHTAVQRLPEGRGVQSTAPTTIPSPFAPASAALAPFLSKLATSQVYILHLDTLPWRFKRRIFTVPVVLNLTIAVLMLWRAIAIYPHYIDLGLLALGYESAARVDISDKSIAKLAGMIIRRTAMIGLDVILLKFIAWWPVSFFFEAPANPMSWRLKVGFQETEIVVRESRRWGSADLLKEGKKVEDNAFMKVRVMPAVERRWMEGKSGYLMMGKDWDLDFALMIEAHELVRKGTIAIEEFKKKVLVHVEGSGWCVWEVWRLDEEGYEEEARKKIVQFKDKLMLMGKENLFFRWVELIQYESSQPGGFTRERQQGVVRKAKELFEGQGVDFEQFVTSVGGVQQLPGLDQAT